MIIGCIGNFYLCVYIEILELLNMDKWKEIICGIAPTLATALGGPLAGTAVKYLGDKLLGNESCDEEDIENFILQANPEDLYRVKQLDNDFKVEMKKLDIDVMALSVDNTKSAREMAKINMWPQISLSILFVVGYFAILIMMFVDFISPSETMKDPLLILLGVMTREMPTIMQFWFGSSFGSKKKTEKLTNDKSI